MVETAEAASTLTDRIDRVRRNIRDCAMRANRSPDEITLVAVSKTHPAEIIREAITSGVADLGENRVQEADAKIPEVGRKSAR